MHNIMPMYAAQWGAGQLERNTGRARGHLEVRQHLDLRRAHYVLYVVQYIDLVSLGAPEERGSTGAPEDI